MEMRYVSPKSIWYMRQKSALKFGVTEDISYLVELERVKFCGLVSYFQKKRSEMNFPKLYKLTSSKKIQEWEIFTEGNKIITIQGQIDGKKQRYEEVIEHGKNIGRANETTPEEQAELEAKSKWEKKNNKDYHVDIEDCKQKTKIANVGGYLPMLAQSYEKHGEKYLKYPCLVQPKLDGLRCIATKEDGEVKLWFRSGKEITTMSHIIEDLDFIMEDGDILDGELYAHGKDFNTFTGAIRANKNLNPEITEQIKYHIYDFPRIKGLTEKDSYADRILEFKNFKCKNAHIILVSTIQVLTFEKAMEVYKQFIEEGYEGIMFRNINMPYEQKRSYNLLKYKEFIDDEFIIVGAEEGRGILKGHVGSFICKIEASRTLKDIGGKEKTIEKESTVKAKMEGKLEYLKHLWENPEEYLNKPLTIKYQNLSQDCIPRFPVGKTIRFDK